MAGQHGEQSVREAPLRVEPDPHGDDGTDIAAAEPDQYGLRVNWQSEVVKIQAAEFLVATRVQQDARIRAAHDLEVLRGNEDR